MAAVTPQFADAVRAVGLAKAPVHGVIAHSLGATAATMAIASGLETGRVVFLAPAADPDHYSARFARALRISKPVRESMKRRIERRYRVRWSSFRLMENVRAAGTDLLVVHDRGDRKIPVRDGAATASAWPGARFIETRGLGHHKILRNPAVVLATVAFMTAPRPVAEALEPQSSEALGSMASPTSEIASPTSRPVERRPVDLGLRT